MRKKAEPAVKPDYSNEGVVVLIPALNEQGSIASVVREAKYYAEKVIVCDDGSSDNTSREAESAGAIVVRHQENMGKGEALKTGFRECAKHDPKVVVTLDGDGQHDPGDIPSLVEPIRRGDADAVIGSRFIRKAKISMPQYRRIGLSLIGFLDKHLVNSAIRDTQSGFRAYSGNILPIISNFKSSNYAVESEQIGIIEQHGLKVIEVPISVQYKGLAKTSKMNPMAHSSQIISSIIKVSVEKRPLMIFGGAGLFMTILSVAFGIEILQLFNESRYFSVPLSIIALGLAIVGMMLIITAIVLYSNSKLRERIGDIRRDLAMRDQ